MKKAETKEAKMKERRDEGSRGKQSKSESKAERKEAEIFANRKANVFATVVDEEGIEDKARRCIFPWRQ